MGNEESILRDLIEERRKNKRLQEIISKLWLEKESLLTTYDSLLSRKANCKKSNKSSEYDVAIRCTMMFYEFLVDILNEYRDMK